MLKHYFLRKINIKATMRYCYTTRTAKKKFLMTIKNAGNDTEHQ